ncbi:hypothetical protein E4U48_002948 [Claviceps purpurea]|nr:hypothetical protein E4U25_003357 [Claviceps purpurea]KAG6273153.1 hypothetical protein E4U48_002948 [Claviceps purpurea]
MWEYAVVSGHEKHNHEPSLHAVAHPVHRRRTAEHKNAIRELSALPGIKACEVAERLKRQYPEALVTGRDIENERQTARRDPLAQSHHEPPVKARAKDKPKYGTPEEIYAQYKFARTKWYEETKNKLPVHLRTNEVHLRTNEVHLRTNEVHRKIERFPTISESKYAWCVGRNYMGKECNSVSPNRPWTEEEKMAWLDDYYREEGVATKDDKKEHADNNFSFLGRGPP